MSNPNTPKEAVRRYLLAARACAGGDKELAAVIKGHGGGIFSVSTVSSYVQGHREPNAAVLFAIQRAFPQRLSLDRAALVAARPSSLEDRMDRLEHIVALVQENLNATRANIELPPAHYPEPTEAVSGAPYDR